MPKFITASKPLFIAMYDYIMFFDSHPKLHTFFVHFICMIKIMAIFHSFIKTSRFIKTDNGFPFVKQAFNTSDYLFFGDFKYCMRRAHAYKLNKWPCVMACAQLCEYETVERDRRLSLVHKWPFRCNDLLHIDPYITVKQTNEKIINKWTDFDGTKCDKWCE